VQPRAGVIPATDDTEAIPVDSDSGDVPMDDAPVVDDPPAVQEPFDYGISVAKAVKGCNGRMGVHVIRRGNDTCVDRSVL
jgi:hypothetical protein